MKILISGAGIAGPALAYWLTRYGMEPTLVERAPQLRTGGYIIDFFGAGFDIAGRMGLLPEIRAAGYVVREVRVVDTKGRKVAAFPTDALLPAAGGGFVSLPRGDLAGSIFGSVSGHVETIFSDSVRAIEQSADEVRVEFEHGSPRSFDLLVGADGLHSRTRELVFGPESRFERYLGVKVAAFQVERYRPRDELVYVMYSEVGQQVSRFSMRNDRTMFLFTWADDDPSLPPDVAAQKAYLRQRFGHSGWEWPRIVESLDATPELYFDRISQIRMDPAQGLWSKGRVSLVGDAASCISLLGGQGSALAMIAAYVLAGELKRSKGDYRQAFDAYQKLFGPFVEQKQRAARRFAGAFAPKSKMTIFLRNSIFRLMSIGWLASLVAGRGFGDKIQLPDYEG